MSETCNETCSTCGEDCNAEEKKEEKFDFSIKLNENSSVKKVF